MALTMISCEITISWCRECSYCDCCSAWHL